MDAQSLAHLVQTLSAPTPIGGDQEGLWPENASTVVAFLAVSLQWRVVSRGGGGFSSVFGGSIAPVVPMFIGLDYSAVRAGLDAEGIEVTPELWRGLRVMEAEACAVLNESSR
jgi:uncharacterized protein DUF1799